MRVSVLSRSVIAIASLGIGSVALTAVPAPAATPSGISRDMVLTAAAGVRAAPPGTAVGPLSSGPGFGPAANRAIKSMVNRVCVSDPDGPEFVAATFATATTPPGSADGLVLGAYIVNGESSPSTARLCTFGALAPIAGQSVLTGTANLTGGPATALSRDAFVTSAVNIVATSGLPPGTPTFSAVGSTVETVGVKVKDKKTAKEKKAAKRKYAKRVTAAKKAYAKAIDDAGNSKRKKAYKAKLASSKAKYRYAIANYKINKTKVKTPFSVSAQLNFP